MLLEVRDLAAAYGSSQVLFGLSLDVAPGEVDLDQLVQENERQESINKMGNLTLLTQKLNSTVSNGAFSLKLPAVKAHAALTINRDLHLFDKWDEETIFLRGTALFEQARRIWAGPSVSASP